MQPLCDARCRFRDFNFFPSSGQIRKPGVMDFRIGTAGTRGSAWGTASTAPRFVRAECTDSIKVGKPPGGTELRDEAVFEFGILRSSNSSKLWDSIIITVGKTQADNILFFWFDLLQ